jgi:hypothetical protein
LLLSGAFDTTGMYSKNQFELGCIIDRSQPQPQHCDRLTLNNEQLPTVAFRNDRKFDVPLDLPTLDGDDRPFLRRVQVQ